MKTTPKTKEQTTGKLNIQIKAPDMVTAEFKIRGTAPLVVRKFSTKAKTTMQEGMEGGEASKNKKVREAIDFDVQAEEGRYRSRDGWEGFNAAGVRCAMIDVCRLTGTKMTKAKMCVFVHADGRDRDQPEIPLIRINGTSRTLVMPVRFDNGATALCARPCYDEWEATLRIQFDRTQFTHKDIATLLMRVGLQCGLCEGRPFSKNSAGMGWGTFEIVNS